MKLLEKRYYYLSFNFVSILFACLFILGCTPKVQQLKVDLVPISKTSNCDPCTAMGFQLTHSYLNSREYADRGEIIVQDRITVTNENVIKITAELVFFSQTFSDPLCIICTKENKHLGAFAGPQGSMNRNVIMTSNTSDWNSTYASYTNIDGSEISRELSWETVNSTGADLSGFIVVRSNIGISNKNDLACCSDQIKTCIRYTATGINNVCNQLVCYTIDRDHSPGGPVVEPTIDRDIFLDDGTPATGTDLPYEHKSVIVRPKIVNE